jgi:hypothetical protein
VAGTLLGLSLRVVLFLTSVLALRGVASLATRALAWVPWVDPVYTRAALWSLSDLRIQGLAISGPMGARLHQFLPGLVVEPALARDALARVAVEPGSPVLARLVAAGLAHAGVLAVGLLLVRAGSLRHRPAVVIAGVAVQAQVALGILGARPSLGDLEATGLAFGANALLPWLWLRGLAVGDLLAGVAPPVLVASLVGLALAIGYLPAGLVIVGRRRARAVSVLTALGLTLGSAAGAAAWQSEADSFTPAAELAASAVEPPAAPDPLDIPQPSPPPNAPAGSLSLPPPGATRDGGLVGEPAAQPAQPSRVEVVGDGSHFQYLVNGQPDVILGMGLNTQYARTLGPSERGAKLDADFAALRALGVNTLVGWDPQEFDALLLEKAGQHGLGVVLPFDLDPSADYTDPALRADLSQQVLAWVDQYRNFPALRMWGLGNEVLHKIVHPAWVGPQDPARDQNAQAFSDWLVETADAIHAADPNHPVTYRSAEDAFYPWVLNALRRAGGEPRPWFVWGTNCYQARLAEIVEQWPDTGMEVSLWVSEFAPGGLAVPDRPDGFRTMWGYVRRYPDWVLGGAVYAWTRNGPEGVDRNFGLTDDGVPVDGRSLDALAELFHAEQ